MKTKLSENSIAGTFGGIKSLPTLYLQGIKKNRTFLYHCKKKLIFGDGGGIDLYYDNIGVKAVCKFTYFVVVCRSL